jgi:pimeloyl-ACP methyl ester carboxylesterase
MLKNWHKLQFRLLLAALAATASATVADGTVTEYAIDHQRKMYLETAGRGTPVVLMIAGYKERGDYAFDTVDCTPKTESVFSAISKFTTATTYDRPGTINISGDSFAMSRSTPVAQPVTVNDQVSDLEAIIKSAKIEKPFILLAHSAGGLIARLYAFKHPQDIAGMVLLDVTTEDLKDKWDRKEWTIFDYSNNVLLDERLYQRKDLEWMDMPVSFFQMQNLMGKGKNRAKLRTPHTVVLTADKKVKAADMTQSEMWPNWVTQKTADDIVAKVLVAQNELVDSFVPPAEHITQTNSGHKIQAEQPQLVVEVVRTMVEQVRAHH